MVEIKRDRYLQQLIESRQNGLVKVVTGIRRCGKWLRESAGVANRISWLSVGIIPRKQGHSL